MTLSWKVLAVMLISLIKRCKQSIAGVTYTDDFDFEERYRNVFECDPMYWHPLHLPDECMRMYEKLIRSGIARSQPVTIMRENDQSLVYQMYPMKKSSSRHRHRSQKMRYVSGELVDTMSPTVLFKANMARSWLTPYEKMLASLRQDVITDPRAAQIEVLPNFGPVALYRQPISRRSEKWIKKIAGAYKLPETEQNTDDTHSNYNIQAQQDGKNIALNNANNDNNGNNDKQDIQKIIGNVANAINSAKTGKQSKRNGPRVSRKQIKKGNMVAIFENKRIV